MKKSILILFLLLNSFVNAQDQEATLFFNDGSSLKGYGFIQDSHTIKFRLTLDDKPDKWTHHMVESIEFYGFNKVVRFEYQYKSLYSLHPRLLETVEVGNVNLYVDTIGTSFFIPTNVFRTGVELRQMKIKGSYYIKKEGEDSVIKLNREFYYTRAQEYFKDCPSLVDKIKTEKYRKSKRLDLIYFYNDLCDDEIFEEED